MSPLEDKLREVLTALQDVHVESYGYPNPYVGLPSPLTAAIINAEQWIKKAIAEVIADDTDSARGGKRANPLTANTGLQKVESETE